LNTDAVRVFVHQEPSGTLLRWPEQRDILFTYDDLFAQPVSLTMPIHGKDYKGVDGGLPPIFQMNLPEGRLRDLLERRFRKTSPDRFDDLTFLKILGPSQVGRLGYNTTTTHLTTRRTGLPTVQDFLTYKGSKDLFTEWFEVIQHNAHISGVQPKMLVQDEAAWALSGDGRQRITVCGATHIVKSWEGHEFPELAFNEFFCMEAAKEAGLPTPIFQLSDDRKFLIIERFDINAHNGQYLGFEETGVLRNLPTNYKYDGSYEKLAKTLNTFLSEHYRAAGLEQFFRMLVVNCLVKNGDAHLKNFGVIYDDINVNVRMAPAYDIVCTSVYLPNDCMALTLDGRKSYPSGTVLQRFGQEHCGLTSTQTRQIIEQAIDAINHTSKKIRAYLQALPKPISPYTQPCFDLGNSMLEIWKLAIKRIQKSLI
jgi:serine/threonine-protein kinase HipA